MPTQVYFCPIHGEFDTNISFSQDVPQEMNCPEKKQGRACCEISRHVLKTPAGIKIKNTWNDNANEMRRDPYTQAKYQAQHTYDEQRDQGIDDLPKVTEKGLQTAATRIDQRNKSELRSLNPEERAKRAALRSAKKIKKEE